MAHRLKGHGDGDQVDDHLLTQGIGPAPEHIPPGAVPDPGGEGGLAFLEAQGLGLQGEGDLHRLAGVAARRKFLIQHHLLLAVLGKGDLHFFKAAALVTGLQGERGLGPHHLHRGLETDHGIVKIHLAEQ